MTSSDAKRCNFCPAPFESIEIHGNGDVYFCCPYFTNHFSIGNVFKDDINDIWNSERAIQFRKSVLNGDYSYCDKNVCINLSKNDFSTFFDTEYTPVMNQYPKKINFCYDHECNIACVICRDKVSVHSEEELESLNTKIDTFFIPILKDAKLLTINSAGEIFASRHSKQLVKKINEVYPNIKYEILTNGILCNEKMLNELGIRFEQIHEIKITLNAATKKCYSRMVKDGNRYYDKIINNLNYISSLKKEYGFYLQFNFVVTSLNYKEMPKFVKLSKKYNAFPFFWEYRPYKKVEFSLSENSNKGVDFYKDLTKVLKTPCMYEVRNNLYPAIRKYQPQCPKYSLWEKFLIALNLY